MECSLLFKGWSGCMSSPLENPLLQCSPSLPVRASQTGPPQSRDPALTHVWLWSRVQSWCAWVCVCFCSQECPEQEPAFVDSSVVSEGFPGGSRGKELACQFRRHKRHRFDPLIGKIPWRRKWHGITAGSHISSDSYCQEGHRRCLISLKPQFIQQMPR